MMDDKKKETGIDIQLPEIDLSKEVEADESKVLSDKAVVPFEPLQRYLAEIRRFPLLTREEEHRLAVEYKEYGNVEAAYTLVTANLRLVVMIAREYQKAFKNLLDLIQEGNMGLMEAVKNFDPYRGVRFPSYAVWWIRAYMIRYIMNDWRMVKIGTTQAQRKLFFNLQKEKEKLEAEGLTPGPKLLAQRLNVKEDEVVEMEQRLAHRDLSVDVPIGEGEEATMLNFLPDEKQSPEEQFAEAQYRQLLREKMELFAKALKDKELVIYRERLLNEDPLTLREIGDKYGISRERVRQIEDRVKKKLKTYLSKELKDVEQAEV
ncbi:MAG: RNA polymerase factor sigma-32 [Candidatus Binatia bacterium]